MQQFKQAKEKYLAIAEQRHSPIQSVTGARIYTKHDLHTSYITLRLAHLKTKRAVRALEYCQDIEIFCAHGYTSALQDLSDLIKIEHAERVCYHKNAIAQAKLNKHNDPQKKYLREASKQVRHIAKERANLPTILDGLPPSNSHSDSDDELYNLKSPSEK